MYLFYDLETSGLEPCWDVPLQAAFLQADANLSAQREVTLRCRLPAHVVPSPDALIVTGVTPVMLENQPLSHLEMMAQIARIIADCKPAMLIGFNTIRFDDEVLRQSFYQTLLPPYAASMTGHGRADVLSMLRAVVMLEPDAVAIPRDDAGKPVLRLGDVCRANGISLSEDDAHDALADVRATLDLFALLLERAPSTMATMLGHAKKSGPLALLEPGEPVILGGTLRLTPVLPMIGSPTNPGARICIDLGQDPSGFIDLPALDLLARIRSSSSPVRQVKVNAQPILFGWDQAAHALVEAEPDSVYRERARALWAHPTFTRQLVLALEGQYADREPSAWPDAQLYSGGFVSDADAAACRRWHEIAWEHRASFAAQHIADPRLRSLAIRQVFLNAPETLSPEAWNRGQDWFRNRLMTEDEVPWLTLPRALARCRELATTADPDQLIALDRISTWFIGRRDSLGPNGETVAMPTCAIVS
ncbi:exonuclease domain-containing protein [Bosea sp. (in: a-proteobacteria)]|jgi:exodeoxyribonuclease-1|uniref:exonuclease domain-containing protein n=1 Tax=Bosea sp. (in: a-proteobacteria) TaxID=1871050 RepID=UPI002DDD4FC6|nr:exonuclease domain-containing protein [Bosea sp. (in: a-proteobacteria)]HEV2510368.1 exonuclease domain-containing protein [Bosea sp. (in: a-proteobacteria)]